MNLLREKERLKLEPLEQSQEYLAGGGSAQEQVAFLDGAFETAESKGETLMSCSPLKEEGKMRNHTCARKF